MGDKQFTSAKASPVVKAAARKRYHSGMSDSRNAIESGVSRQTIAKWKKEGDWENTRIEIEERAKENYIEEQADKLAVESSAVDVDHKEILEALRMQLKKAVKKEEKMTAAEINSMGSFLMLAEKLIKLEREVLGLTSKNNIPKITFPTGFSINLRSGSKPVELDPELTEDEIFEQLPNQHEEFFGSEEELQAFVMAEEDDDDDIAYDQIESIPSLSM